MLFNSLVFLFFFLVVITFLLILKNRTYQHLFLLIASCYFYWYTSGYKIILLFISIIMDYNIGKAIYNSKNDKIRKWILAVSLIGNLGMLFIFKYTNFFIESFNYFSILLNSSFILPVLNIVLPIGISFYTFISLSYTIDIYKKELEPCTSLLEYSLFITFFPHLVAGPILRAANFLPQLKKKIIILPENFKIGLTEIGWGLVKKVIFADTIAIFVTSYFNNPTAYQSSIPVYLGALAFGIQIYCDFSGYSGIAIGTARIMGIEIPINFNKPYSAKNIAEFWRRWHMSLSSFLRDYLYIPLGGSKKGKVRTYINLMITMILGGLWHGAAWNFLLWGFYQGSMLSLHKVSEKLKMNIIFNYLGNYEKYINLIITQYFVFLGWLLFRVSDVNKLLFLIKKYFMFDFINGFNEFSILFQQFTIPIIFMGLFIIFHIYSFFNENLIEKIAKKDIFYWGLFIFLVSIALYFLAPSQSIQFIYFQF